MKYKSTSIKNDASNAQVLINYEIEASVCSTALFSDCVAEMDIDCVHLWAGLGWVEIANFTVFP